MSRTAICLATLLTACASASDPLRPDSSVGAELGPDSSGRAELDAAPSDAGAVDSQAADQGPGGLDAEGGGASDVGQEGDAGPPRDSGTLTLPITRDELVAFVQSGAYSGWSAEARVHRSAGPHGNVRTFVNDALYTSLKSGQSVHPNGSIAVKELYTGADRSGWAVDVKGLDGVWIYFEGFEPQLNQYYFRGDGNLCANCHAGGVDRVLVPASAFP